MAEQEFVIRQTSVEFQNDLDKVERLLEVRSLGVGLRLDAVAKQLSALVTTEENSEAPFEISDDGGYVIFRIDEEGEVLTKAFDSREINQILRIYQLGTGLVLNGNTLSVDGSISGLAKIYSIGQGLTLNNQGELFVNNDLYNLAKIYSIGDGLVLDAQGALSANVSDVTVDGVSVVTSKVARILSQVKTQNTPDGAFELVDDTGNVALRIKSNGHIQVKEFDSEDFAADLHVLSVGSGLAYDAATGALSALIYPNDTTDGAYEIADVNGNVALRITNEGHLLTKEFDSEEVGRLQRIYQIGSGLNLDSSGTLSVTTLGGVTDVRVDGISVVSDTIANIAMPIKTDEGSGAFEIADEAGNVALQITSEGHLKTKEFDSENIDILPPTVNDRYLHTNTSTGDLEWSEVQGGESTDFKVLPTLPPPDTNAPKVVYSLLDGRLYILDMGGSASSIVGVGLVGYMIVG